MCNFLLVAIVNIGLSCTIFEIFDGEECLDFEI